MTESISRRIRGAALVAVSACAVYAGLVMLQEANDAAVKSYLCSVCAAVEHYRLQNGNYPSDLDLIDKSQLDDDVGISLDSLAYEVDGSNVTVSYSPEGETAITCNRPVAE